MSLRAPFHCHWHLLTILATIVGLLAIACTERSPATDPAVDSLAEGSWPTESLNSAAGATKKLFLDSIQGGALDPEAAAQIFTQGFRGEDFHQRPTDDPRVESGISLAEWQATAAELDAATFHQRWNAYLANLGEVQSVEIHTWEIQLRPQADGQAGLETREAVWILSQLPDGRLREERLYLIIDLIELAGDSGWRIASLRSADGRTSIAAGPFFHDVTHRVLPPGFDQIGAQIYTDGGPVLADFDGDHDVDLFMPRLHAPARLYENDGSGHFEDVTTRRGLELNLLRQGSNSGLFLDLDRDGLLDLVIGSKEHGLLLLRNDGNRFHDATGSEPLAEAGDWESLAAADYDGDGWIDIYLTQYNLIDADHQPESYIDAQDGRPNVLLRNLGGEGTTFTFADVTTAAGLKPQSERWSYAASWADYDRDGDLDLFVANDYGRNSLYRNRGGAAGFDEVASEVGADDLGNGMGASWADLDGDLWLDLYISNMQSFAGNRITRLENFPGSDAERTLYRRFSQGNTLLHNLGDGTFEDATEGAGLRGAFWAWGNLAFDYDADADLDIFVCGGFYTGVSAKDT